MTAAMSEHQPADGWTVDDLECFPDDNVRRELLDGVLLVSPPPPGFTRRSPLSSRQLSTGAVRRSST
jgi:Uma2 family endonuclease